jgi:histidinol-phosphate aminotransferase
MRGYKQRRRKMTFQVIEYLNPVETYVPGLRVPEVAEQFGIPPERIAKLASAENPLGPSPRAVAAIREVLEGLSLYPDWRAESLRESIAAHNGIKTEQVMVGCGETELLSFLFRAFSEQGDEILFPIPTFPIYEQAALVERRRPVAIPMESGFRIDPERLLGAVTKKTRILVLTSPNNPLSTAIEPEILKHILANLPGEILILLDEAYVDYSDGGSKAELLSDYPNLVVMRTFSKIYGLAGLRVGYGLAHEIVVRAVMKIKPAWNIGHLASVGAAAALEDRGHYEKTRSLIKENRDYLTGRLSEMAHAEVVTEPQANFVCIRIENPLVNSTGVFKGLLQGGVIVKDCSVSYKGMGDRYIRVDVNLRPKMDQFLEQFSKVTG